MKRILGLVVAGGLWLGMASAADAQFSLSVGNPYTGGVSIGVPGYVGGVYGAPYVGYGSGVVPGATVYSSGYYGVYPGVTTYSSGYYPVAPGLAYPAYGYRSFYGVAPYPAYGRFGYLGLRRRAWGFW